MRTTNMPFIIIGVLPGSLLNFRGDLIKALVIKGYIITVMASKADRTVVSKLADIGVDFRTYRSLRKEFKIKPKVILTYAKVAKIVK